MVAQINMLPKPESGIRGTVSAHCNIKGRDRQVAHAYIMEGKPKQATVRLPTSGSMSIEAVRAFAAELVAFADAVEGV